MIGRCVIFCRSICGRIKYSSFLELGRGYDMRQFRCSLSCEE
jgi:hypothetical protein